MVEEDVVFMHNNQVRKAKTCKGQSELAFKFKVIFLQTVQR